MYLCIELQHMARLLALDYGTKRVGIAVIGLEVPHAHIHLLPLQSVEDINFSNPKLTVSTDEMQAIAAKIRVHLK